MSSQPKPRDRSTAAKIAKEEADLAKLKQAQQRKRARITALKAGVRKFDRKDESRDKVLVGIAALAAIRSDSSLAYLIETAIGKLDRYARDHLARDGSLWRQAQEAALKSDSSSSATSPSSVPGLPEVEPQAADDPDMVSITMRVAPKEQWRWYDTWKDHEDVMHAMGMENDAHAWLAKTTAQIKVLTAYNVRVLEHLNGMSAQDILDQYNVDAEKDREAARLEQEEKVRKEEQAKEQARQDRNLKRRMQRNAKGTPPPA